MSIQPIPLTRPDAPLAFPLFPLSVPLLESPEPEVGAASIARQLSRWDSLEEVCLPEERDFLHSGINE